jgi:hemerythrin-like domain-containing protein
VGIMTNYKELLLSNPLVIASNILQVGAFRPLKDKGEALEEKMATPVENLMKEHGVLMRILAIYDKVVGDVASGKEFNVSAINRTAEMSRSYIGRHHDACEERYIFPKFREADYITDIIKELHDQHAAAVMMTNQILELSSNGGRRDENSLQTLKDLCTLTSRMYRPHMAWEQTIVFPAFYDIVSADYIRSIQKEMDAEEKKLLGDTGFRGLVGRLSEIEKEVGTYDLSNYTPVLR